MTQRSATLPTGSRIKDIPWEDVVARQGLIRGWIYPKRSISQWLPLFTKPQQLAISFWIVVSAALFAAGVILPFFAGPGWLLLLIASVMTWKANRTSMEQFFVENLKDDKSFYDALRQTEMSELVSVVFKE